MIKVRLILMFQGRVEHDFETQMIRPRLKETISIHEFDGHYKIEFIQHMFDNKGRFKYLMVTGIKKI